MYPSKIERMIMDKVNASSDRVMIHQAMKHLIVGGNALMYMGKEGIKHYSLLTDMWSNVMATVTSLR